MIDAIKEEAAAAIARNDFAAAMSAMAKLRNRLKLLNQIREATRAVAYFSRIEGQ